MLAEGFANHPLDPVTPGGKTDILARDHHPQAGTYALIASEKYQIVAARDAFFGAGENSLEISRRQQPSRPGKRCGGRDTNGHRPLRPSGAYALWPGDASGPVGPWLWPCEP